MNRPNRNDPCPCGSGKKYKRCCGANQSNSNSVDRAGAEQVFRKAFAHHQQGDLASAALLYDQVLAKLPDETSVMGLRGMAAMEQGELAKARRLIEKAIEISPKDSRLRNFLGQVMVRLDLPVDAERAFAQAVSLDENFLEAWCNLGLCLVKADRLVEGIDAFEKARVLAPKDIEVIMNLAEARYLLGKRNEARQNVLEASKLDASTGHVNMWLALLARADGDVDASVSLENNALQTITSQEEQFGLLTKFGQLDVLAGNMTQAQYWFEQAIKIFPDTAEPYIGLADAKRFAESDIALVRKMEALVGMQPESGRKLEFALGKIYGDLNDYAHSFEHYQKANEIARDGVFFDPEALIKEVDRTIQLFSSDFLGQLPKGSESELPIIVVGTPRSGTTLVEQIISSHSRVAGAGELTFWGRLAPSIINSMPRGFNSEVAQKLAEGYISLLRRYSSSSERIVDKMPSNFAYLGLIHAVFPQAKIVHCRRHPIDACLSMYFQNFNNEHTYKFTLDGLVLFYEQYIRLMQHWHEVLPAHCIYDLQYEQLVENQLAETQKLMSFLELDLETGQMEFYKQDRAIFTASKWQARQPIYKTSTARWKNYEPYLGPLKSLEKYVSA